MNQNGNLADQIVSDLISGIREGVLPVGKALPTERELSVRFGTSRPTVREALSRISLLGYAKTDAGKRPIAKMPTLGDAMHVAREHIGNLWGEPQSIAYLEQLRVYIECGAAREAVRRAGGLELAKIKAALDANKAAINTPEFPKTDIEFHRAIVEISANPILQAMHELFIRDIIKNRSEHVDQSEHDRRVYLTHEAIFDALLDQKENELLQLIEDHLSRSYRRRLKAQHNQFE